MFVDVLAGELAFCLEYLTEAAGLVAAFKCLGGMVAHEGGRAVLFDAASLPAAALSTVGYDQRMPQLRAYLVGAVQHLAVDDHSAADARSERKQHHVATLLAGAAEELAKPGSVGVVFQRARQIEGFGYPCLERNVRHARDIRGVVDDALGHAQRSGRADAYADDVAVGAAGLAHGLAGAGDHLVDYAVDAFFLWRGELEYLTGFAALIEQAELYERSAQINAYTNLSHVSTLHDDVKN